MILAISLEDCFFKRLYLKKTGEIGFRLSLQSLGMFAECISDIKIQVVLTKNPYAMFKTSNELENWFGSFGIKINAHKELFISSSFLEQNLFFELMCFFERHNCEDFCILDSSLTGLNWIAEKENEGFIEYGKMYGHILGQKRRESLIPKNEFLTFENKNPFFHYLIKKNIPIKKNQTINTHIIKKLKRLLLLQGD